MDKMPKSLMPVLFMTCLAMLFITACRDDFESLDPAEIYVKYFGTTREDEVIDMIQTPDGGFLLLGYTRDTDLGSRDYLVIKTDADGNRKWQKQYDGKLNTEEIDSDDLPSSIRLGATGNYALVMGTAYLDTEFESMFMLRIGISDVERGVVNDTLLFQYDDQRILDSLDVEYEFNGLKKTRGADVIEFGSSYIILGSVETGLLRAAEANRYNIYLVSIPQDSDGQNENWDEFDGFNTGNDLGVKLLEDRGEYFYLASSEDPDQGNVSKVMVKHFDEVSGNEEADARRFGMPGLNDVPVNFTSDQFNLFVTGASGENLEERAFFLRVNKSLQDDEDFIRIESLKYLDKELTIQDESYTGEDEGSRGQDIVGLDNGDFYIIGQVNNYTNSGGELKQNEIGLIRVDGQGNLIPGALQLYGSDDNDWGKAILRDSVSNALIIGTTVHFGGGATMMSLLKTNRNGELGE